LGVLFLRERTGNISDIGCAENKSGALQLAAVPYKNRYGKLCSNKTPQKSTKFDGTRVDVLNRIGITSQLSFYSHKKSERSQRLQMMLEKSSKYVVGNRIVTKVHGQRPGAALSQKRYVADARSGLARVPVHREAFFRTRSSPFGRSVGRSTRFRSDENENEKNRTTE